MIEFKPLEQTKIQVHLRGATPFTEIYVVDARFKRLESFLGQGDITLDTGTYTFRFQEGDKIRDTITYVSKNSVIEDPRLRSQVIVPTSSPDDFANGIARIAKRLVGIGSSALPILDYSLPAGGNSRGSDNARPRPWLDFRVGLTGAAARPRPADDLLDKDQPHPKDPDLRQCFFTLKSPDRGMYRLPLLLHRQWHTSLALENPKRPDQLLINMERGDQYEQDRLRQEFGNDFSLEELSRLALQALGNNRSVVADNVLRFLVYNKWQLPWHGILALHMQTKRAKPNMDLISIMLDNLQHLYGIDDHPDIVAVQWWYARQDEKPIDSIPRLAFPPTLSNSWRLLLEADARHPGKVLNHAEFDETALQLEANGPILFSTTRRSPANQSSAVRRRAADILLDAIYADHDFVNQAVDTESGELSTAVLASTAKRIRGAEENSYPMTALFLALFATPDQALASADNDQLVDALIASLDAEATRRALLLGTGYSLQGLKSLVPTLQEQL